MQRFLILIIVLLLAGRFEGTEGPKQLASGAMSSSPNRAFKAVYKPDNIEIHDARAKQLYKLEHVLPVYSLKWTGDSKTLIIVYHLAGGSAVTLAHFDGTKWSDFDVQPPGEDYDRLAVVVLTPKQSDVEVAYRMGNRDPQNPSWHFWKCKVDPATRQVSDIQKKSISVEEFLGLKEFGAK